jgi:acetylornithine deacetylase/succinyl-diaminopimelate desuccinylase-like protein
MGSLWENDEPSPEEIRARVRSIFPRIRRRLEDLVSIPSVSAEGFPAERVRDSASATAEWLADSGFSDVRLLHVEGSHPAVYGFARGPVGSPRVLLYAHHDVQPPGDLDLWETPPWEPTERHGRLFGRGTADDKAGIAVHAAALRAWNGKPPLDVVALIEGDEEAGSVHLPEFLSTYRSLLQADAVVIADCSTWAIGQPALVTSLRGVVDCVVEVRALDHAAHSGKYGGPVPDALTALCRLIATLHDSDGNITVKGLHSGPPPAQTIDERNLRELVGLRPGGMFLGEGMLSHRIWGKPAISVLGIDAPGMNGHTHQLMATARATLSLRVAPGDDAQQAFLAVKTHLINHAPWNAEVDVTSAFLGEPCQIDSSGPIYDAYRRSCVDTWGRLPLETGSGGSLPMAAALADAYPGVALLLTGIDDPESNPHSENESIHLAELENCCVNEAILLGRIAAIGGTLDKLPPETEIRGAARHRTCRPSARSTSTRPVTVR